MNQHATHPRPQLRRDRWYSLDGTWDFAVDADAAWSRPAQIDWNDRIRVPFAPETSASGVGNTGFFKACWYRRRVEVPARPTGSRAVVHFGAVDYQASVWADGQFLVRHEGGYTPFSVDVSEQVPEAGGEVELIVRAEDDPHDLAKPRGKQDWQLNPHSIWYPRTTGIWQSVWLEIVPESSIGRLAWSSSLERWEIGLEALIDGKRRSDLRLRVTLSVGDLLLADDTYAVLGGEVHRRIALSDPGIDDYRNELLWSPASPTLIHARLQLLDEQGVVDTVHSYTALRSISIQGDRFVLNGRPLTLRLVLDQGYWPETGLTAPEGGLRRDVELAKAMGFNGVRKHQKIEDPRFLYWADTLGLLVWEEMPSAYRFTPTSVDRLTREWVKVIQRDRSHPCIVAWVPFNESWGVPDLPESPSQRHYVEALYHLTRTLDPSRPVIGNDGWESVATDIIGIHDYDDQVQRIAARYGADDLPRLFQRERPGGRILLLGGQESSPTQPIMLTEFGGIACAPGIEGTWGYSRVEDAATFAERYTRLLAVVRGLPVFAGFCYTQFTDTYQEANGLLFADRTPKVPLEVIAQATRGPSNAQEQQLESVWREELMKRSREQHPVPSTG